MKNGVGSEKPTRTEVLERVAAAWLDIRVPPKFALEWPSGDGSYYYHVLLGDYTGVNRDVPTGPEL